jgi:SnoaL-like domain
MDEDEVQWAVDELKIRNVIAQLALLSDMGDIEEWGALFAEDADYTTGSGNAWHGRADIVASGQERREKGTHGPGSGNRHLSASVFVRQTGPDSAEAESYLEMYRDVELAETGSDGQPTKSPTLMVFGYYRDRFVRTSDGWKVAHRDLVQTSHTPEWTAVFKRLWG